MSALALIAGAFFYSGMGEMPKDNKMPDQLEEKKEEAKSAEAKSAEAGGMPASWQEYLDKQPEAVKSLYSSHAEGLLNTVKATRLERDALARQVKDLAKAQAEGSDARKQLDEFSGRLEDAERRATFLEDAPAAQCKNPKAAWLLAKAGDHFDRQGRPDWASIKAEAPELFGVVTAKSNAGTGTEKAPTSRNMNDFIRKAAGRS